jgi:ABC-2 type transport system ATP-binding protein
MYVREYLDFIAGVHEIADKKKAIEDVILLTGLSVESKKKISQLSKGYKQRVGLAAALIHDPEVLILDEPTSGLDPNQIIEIRNVIKAQGKNKTVLFSSHILQEVEAICDRVIIINRGQIVADDQLKNLQKNKSDKFQVRVCFQEEVEIDLLQHLSEVLSVNRISTNEYLLSTKDSDTVRKQLLELTIAQNLNIISLQTERHSLEDVFRALTK